MKIRLEWLYKTSFQENQGNGGLERGAETAEFSDPDSVDIRFIFLNDAVSSSFPAI